MKHTTLLLFALAALFLCGCDSCDVVRVAQGKLHFSDGKSSAIPHWNEEGWTHFFFVRHAEKLDASDDTDLSPAGYERAERLGRIMANSGVDLVFATDKRRTQKTADPVRIRANTPPVGLYPRDDAGETAWLQAQLSANRGKRIFVVGHSNTVPRMLYKLVGRKVVISDESANPPYGELEEKNFGAFFVVASRGLGDSEYLWRAY